MYVVKDINKSPLTKLKREILKNKTSQTTRPKIMLTEEEGINTKFMKKIITEKKTIYYHHSGTKAKEETEKANISLPNISNITEINELFYAGAKLVRDKIGVPLENPNKNTKPRWEIRLEATRTSERTKEGKTHKDIFGWKDQNKTSDKSESTTGKDE